MHSDGWSCIQAGHFDSRFIWVMYIFTIFFYLLHQSLDLVCWTPSFSFLFWVPSCLAHWVVALCHQMETQFESLYPLDELTFLVSMKCLCFPWQNSLSWDPSSHYRLLLMNLCICTNFHLFIFSTLLKLHGLGFPFSLLIPTPSPSQAFYRWVNLNSEAQDRN